MKCLLKSTIRWPCWRIYVSSSGSYFLVGKNYIKIFLRNSGSQSKLCMSLRKRINRIIRVKLRCFFQIRDNCWGQECLPSVIFSATFADQNSMRTMANSNFRLRSITIRVKFSGSYIHSVYCEIYAVYIYAVVILMSIFAFEAITEGTYK